MTNTCFAKKDIAESPVRGRGETCKVFAVDAPNNLAGPIEGGQPAKLSNNWLSAYPIAILSKLMLSM